MEEDVGDPLVVQENEIETAPAEVKAALGKPASQVGSAGRDAIDRSFERSVALVS